VGPGVLSVRDLCKSYGDTVAVERISFDVCRREIVGLLGPNGAGKTTTINMILGVLAPDGGSIQIDGVDLTTHRSQALACTNFAAVYAPLPGNLTVAQNLRIFGMIYSVRNLTDRIETLLEEFDLVGFRDIRCGVLSSGEQTRVCLAKAMLNGPTVTSAASSACGDTMARGSITSRSPAPPSFQREPLQSRPRGPPKRISRCPSGRAPGRPSE